MKLFIPEKINVGFQERQGTYTGKLAYIIYFDEKGKLRKEKSWTSWRDKSIDPIQFDNTPMEGFVLNKGVGGARASYGWNARNEYIRIYDPRDFEFEISVANLLFILRENDCMKGKGLTGQYVYGWDGTELVLLPTNSEDYKESVSFTAAKSNKVSMKDLKVGYQYRLKDLSIVTYIGKHTYYENDRYKSWRYEKTDKHGKVLHIFYKNRFFPLTSGSSLSEELLESDEYANLVEKYYNSIFASEVDKFIVDGVEKDTCEVFNSRDGYSYYTYAGTYYLYHFKNRSVGYDYRHVEREDSDKLDQIESLKGKNKLRLKNGKLFTISENNIKEYCDEPRQEDT